jgi:hypothetical protein
MDRELRTRCRPGYRVILGRGVHLREGDIAPA